MSEEELAQLQRQIQRERTARKEAERLLEEKSLALYRTNQQLQMDITERKRTEAQLTDTNNQLKQAQSQLLQSEKMASIGLLAAGVAHEINNPIGYVNSNLGTLEKYMTNIFVLINKYEAATSADGADNPLLNELRQFKTKINLGYILEDTKALIAESHQGLERVKKIVLDLKEFSHAESEDQWTWEDVHQGLESTLNVVWNELKYKCEVVKEYATLPKISCLPAQLNQVFMNLLVNAAQAIEVRGTITLRSGQEGDSVWIEVSDTGNGIAPEIIPRLFDPFFTTKPVGKGTGLGLSVSYKIIEKHHGKIEVHSEVGKGSTFRVWLPVKQPETEENT
jgi:signal transduction histidine kinase